MTAPNTLDESTTGFGTADGQLVFSGHESFACRYGWLPKLHEAVADDPTLFESPERAIVRLGIGRNMVKSIRFWADAFGLTTSHRGRTCLTAFASHLLDPIKGRDPYLESQDSLWRLHWMLTVHGRLGAWAVAFLETHDREILRERLVASVAARAAEVRGRVAARTATNHVDIFLRTYAATRRPGASDDDLLASPFQELALVSTGTRAGLPSVQFSRGPKPSLTTGAFAFAVRDFWHYAAPGSASLSVRSLMLGYCAPGSVYLLDEVGLHDSAERLCTRSESLALRPDGAGGFTLTSRHDPLAELERIAWT